MGASESLLPVHRHQPIDEITTVSQRIEGVDPLLERVEALKIATPLLTSPPPSESSLSDILVRKPSSSSSSTSTSGTLNPNVLLELFSMYREWQEEKAKKISRKQIVKEYPLAFFVMAYGYLVECVTNSCDLAKQAWAFNVNCSDYKMLQEEIESKIETADALAVKLFQRFNYSVSAMRSTTQSLAEVQQLQVEVGELKGRLTEVISNCDMLCKRIVAEGPESLRSSLNPISTSNAEMPSICYLNNKVPDE
ncbi:hypothetical protein MUK42_19846 [Musa troglodytarum]|uniref:Uncharacterized protein n=1 Tax=Musa troglodytarum TaxID=320322 RepID=A0A9E7K3K4_9LILI|nr:hypothetical protein MUK42_19846 [Musa troglodytarum]